MLCSILDMETKTHPNMELPTVPGQRLGDRALYGGNLQHDVMALMAAGYDDITGMKAEPRRLPASSSTTAPTTRPAVAGRARLNFYTEDPAYHTTCLPPLGLGACLRDGS